MGRVIFGYTDKKCLDHNAEKVWSRHFDKKL